MSIVILIAEALRSLRANTSRTLLSILGIVIGILSVTILLTLGEGAQAFITGQLSSIGADTISVFGGSSNNNVRDSSQMIDTSKLFTLDILQGIEIAVRGIPALSTDDVSKRMVGADSTSKQTISYQNTSISATIYGVTKGYDTINNIEMKQGSYIAQRYIDAKQKVVVLGPTLATSLFGKEDPIGKSIQLGQSVYTVIGITTEKESRGFNGENDRATIPISAMNEFILGSPYIGTIYIKAASLDDVNQIKPYVNSYITSILSTKGSKNNTLFTIFDAGSQLTTINTVITAIQAFLGAVAVISLLVGGIGVMNIMLVSVSERTQEIGVRKAIGALDSIILQQFLIESVVLTFSGGLIAVMLSYLIIIGFNVSGVVDTTFTISIKTLAISFGFAAAVGIIFGLLPARKASSLKPIDALRFQ